VKEEFGRKVFDILTFCSFPKDAKEIYFSPKKENKIVLMGLRSALVLVGLLAGLVASFEIKTFSPKNLAVEEGSSVKLYCAVDGYYEWCTFRRQDGKICDFEWKRDLWDVDVLQCSDFAGRMTRTGKGSHINDITLH